MRGHDAASPTMKSRTSIVAPVGSTGECMQLVASAAENPTTVSRLRNLMHQIGRNTNLPTRSSVCTDLASIRSDELSAWVTGRRGGELRTNAPLFEIGMP